MTEKNIFLYGIFKAGKTSVSETIKCNKSILAPKPTLAVNMDNWLIEGQSLRIWDAPGQIKLLKMTWKYVKKHGINKNMILIFILDTADKEGFDSAYHEFLEVINDSESYNAPLLFSFHKMDLQEAKDNLEEAKKIFDLDSIQGRYVLQVETSVKDLQSICNLKNKLLTLVK